jgi:hypothetical protein
MTPRERRRTLAMILPRSAKFFFAAFTAFSCGSGGSPADAGADGTVKDVAIDVVVDPANCVMPGTPNDDRGVGGYCSPGGGQCASSGPGGAPRICTADLPSAQAHDWYCTYPCSQSSDCGSAASCVATAQGMMCIPPACAPAVDASTDAASDAEADAPTDAPTDG